MTIEARPIEIVDGSEARFARLEQVAELSVFLFLIVPSMALSFFAVKQGTLSFVLVAVATILRDLALVSLILFFLWRNAEPVSRIGWDLTKPWREVLLGLVLFPAMFWGAALLEKFLLSAGFSTPSTPLPSAFAVRGMGEAFLGLVLVSVVAVAEETIFRGYLILRFRGIGATSAAAVILSAFVFSLGHGYEGSAGVVTVGTMGAVFAIIYLWRGSLIAPIVMHFLQDFVAILLLPALLSK
jgi:membrane protease YdiL (CAAX protease family)